MKKLIIRLLAMSMFLCMMVSPVRAETDYVTVELLSAKIDTAFKKDEVEVIYSINNQENMYIAEVIDLETDEIIEVYTEKPSISVNDLIAFNEGIGKQRNDYVTYTTTWGANRTVKTINDDGVKYYIEAYVWVVVNISGGTYWRQVNNVESYGHQSGGSGAYTLIPAYTDWLEKDTPFSTSLDLRINGTIEVSSSNSAGWEFTLLEDIGFSMSGSSSSNWYARDDYNTIVSFEVMP